MHIKNLFIASVVTLFGFFWCTNAIDYYTNYTWWNPENNETVYWSIAEWTAGCATFEYDHQKKGYYLTNFRMDWGCPDDITIPETVNASYNDFVYNIIWINLVWSKWIENAVEDDCTPYFKSLKIPNTVKYIKGYGGIVWETVEIEWHDFSRQNSNMLNIKAKNVIINTDDVDWNLSIDGYIHCDNLKFWKNVKNIISLPVSNQCVVDWYWFKKIPDAKKSNGIPPQYRLKNSYSSNLETIEYIWDYSFQSTLETSIKIWKNLNHIGKWAFCTPIKVRQLFERVCTDAGGKGYYTSVCFDDKYTFIDDIRSNIEKFHEFLETAYCDINNWEGYIWTKIENPWDIPNEVKGQLNDACLFTEDDMPDNLVKCFPDDFDFDKTRKKAEYEEYFSNIKNNKINDNFKIENNIKDYKENNDLWNNTWNSSNQYDLIVNTDSSSSSCSIENSIYWQEENEAFLFACENWILSTKNIMKANLSNPLTRWEMASIMSLYAVNVLGKKPDESKSCNFNDIHMEFTTESMEIFLWIKKACRLWLMWVWISEFNQDWKVSRAEFWTVMSRLLWWDKYNNVWKNWYDWHLNALRNNWIITNIDPNLTEHKLWVLLQLYRNSKKTNEEKKRHDEYYASQWTPLWFTL